jgi:nitric oxide reductase subunit B
MTSTKRLWIVLATILVASFAALGLVGREIYHAAPPVPQAVKAADGRVLYTRDDVQTGREVWQSAGGQQLGSILGHGAYVAPDWTADTLHREAVAMLDLRARRGYGRDYAQLAPAEQAALRGELQVELKQNTYDAATDTVTVSDDRAAAMAQVAAHYDALFGSDPSVRQLREHYAMKVDTVGDPVRRRTLFAFFHWTAWQSVTNRPDSNVSYSSNWPADTLVGNTPSGASFMWTFISILMMIAGVGALVWHHASSRGESSPDVVPATDPLRAITLTPSMKAVAKYFWVVAALFAVQVGLGGITAHYAVEGQSFYGFQLADVLPYSLTRTWHTQLAVLWIATAWLATGLFIAPAISAHEPKFQRLGVNFLFVCLLVIVVGALGGQWFAVMQKMGLATNFWFGHQGYEYTDIGRFWQAFLFIGLMLWLVLMGRALWPALQQKGEHRTLTWLLFLSTIAIGLFYGAGLMWGRHTALAIVEYWRWWVVHLWVEGFFEVFATAVIAFLFSRLGLVRASTATASVLFATIVFLAGGVLGTLHHLYFTGTPTSVIALGAAFSALEVVPLALIGFEAFDTYRKSTTPGWVQAYRWPILFFVAVSFWNLVGAGLFGFLINPPLALYYMQGLNTTALHGHTALFGVYGMLGIGLMLFTLRCLKPLAIWNEKLIATVFWTLNGGLAAMALLSLLPMGLIQVYASVTHGFWYARSADFLHQPIVQLLVWMRMPGDVVFSVGCLALAWFVMRLWIAPRERQDELPVGTIVGTKGGAPAGSRLR